MTLGLVGEGVGVFGDDEVERLLHKANDGRGVMDIEEVVVFLNLMCRLF
jgi:hypothetical protein